MNWQAAYHNSVLNQTLQLCCDRVELGPALELKLSTTSLDLEGGRQICIWQNSVSLFLSESTQKSVARTEPEERLFITLDLYPTLPTDGLRASHNNDSNNNKTPNS